MKKYKRKFALFRPDRTQRTIGASSIVPDTGIINT